MFVQADREDFDWVPNFTQRSNLKARELDLGR